jgi:hypothetical protein
MDLLQFVLAFNLTGCVIALIGFFYLHRQYDDRVEPDYRANQRAVQFSAAGVSGAVVSIGLLGSLATMFA